MHFRPAGLCICIRIRVPAQLLHHVMSLSILYRIAHVQHNVCHGACSRDWQLRQPRARLFCGRTGSRKQGKVAKMLSQIGYVEINMT